MSMPDYALGVTFDFRFTTRAFATGIPTTLAGSPSMEIYGGNNTTPITAGITLNVDFSGVAGLNHVRVVATSGNGYATATDYSVVIAAGTVGGVSVVGETIKEFSIEAQSALRPTVNGRTLDVTAGGNAGIDWGNVENPTTALNLSATNIDVDQVVASVSGSVGSVIGNIGGGLAGNVGGNVNGDVAGNVDGNILGDVAGNVQGNVNGNLVGDIGGLTAAALADFFLVNSGQTYATAVAGSVVKEIADNATVIGTTDVNVVEISGSGPAADELEAILVGAGGTMTVDITGNITGNLSGSVGSVTGAVGSVTGNVGGNVTGSVGSVVGNVGGNVNGNVVGSVGSVVASVTTTAADQQASADELLNRNLAGGGSGNTRNVRNALRRLRNRVRNAAGTGTVFQEDDTTPAWTAAVTTTPSDPVTEVDPA